MKTNNILDILNEVASDAGKLHKIKILTENKDNETLQSVIKAAYDPYTQYHIKKIPEYTTTDEVFMTLDWAINELKTMLASRLLTGNNARDHLAIILGSISIYDAIVLERIIGRDLRCGFSGSTANKVFGKGFIDKYPCMLASAYKAKNFEAINFPAYVQTKMDGMRANVIVSDSKIEVRSRNGKLIHLNGLFDHYRFTGNGVFDGELVVLNDDGSIMDRKTGNGILNKAVQDKLGDLKPNIKLYAWDYIDLNDFKAGRSVTTYHDRLATLKSKIREAQNDDIVIVDEMQASDMEGVEELFKIALEQGQEGVIVKNFDAPWEDKRSKFQVKMKAEDDIDLLVSNWNEGEGRLKGLMGSVTARTKDNNIEVNVGSGFNDEDRKMKPEDIVGKIITVKYNEVIQSKNKSTKSLFLPIFVELRLDKNEADTWV